MNRTEQELVYSLYVCTAEISMLCRSYLVQDLQISVIDDAILSSLWQITLRGTSARFIHT